MSPAPRRRLGAAALVLALSAGLWAATTPSGATELAQTVLVNPDPVNYTPHVLSGQVDQFARIGSTIYVGGTFSQIQEAGSGKPILNRKNLFAFNVDTGAILTAFKPNVDGEVTSLQVMPGGGALFIGGKFKNVNGAAIRGVAKLNPTTGATITAFSAPTTGNVNALAIAGTRLFVGGQFGKIRKVTRARLAAVNTTTGAVDTTFDLPVTEPYTAGTGPNILKMDVAPGGNRLVVIGNFRTIGGLTRVQVAQIDLAASPAAIIPWATDDWDAGTCADRFHEYVRDVQYSPDGAYFVIVSTGAGYWPQTMCDTVTRWETNAAGPGQHPTWIDYPGGDTTYSVAITGSTVYVGGHMRWMNDAAVGDQAAEGAVQRTGIAALDPQNGVPFDWNPTRNPRGLGVFDMLAVPQGLLVGSDTDFLGGERHAKLGMFPVAGGVVPPVGQPGSLPGTLYRLPTKTCSAVDGSILYRVNAGGGEVDALDCGIDWAADDGSFRNGGSAEAAWSHVGSVDGTVPATTPTSVFDTERWDPDGAPDMQWNFPVPSGTHIQVRVYLANRCGCTSSPGDRVFDVSLDGTPVLDDFDIVANVGDQVGTMKAFDITSDGHVNIDFGHVTENPLIDAIEIVNRDVAPGPAPSSSSTLLRRSGFTGATPGAASPLVTAGVDWSKAQGTFFLNGLLYAGWQDGRLYAWPFNGTSLGAKQDVLADGDYVLGPTWIDFSRMTGMFWKDGRLYYTRQGDAQLFYRYFSPQSQLVNSIEYVAADNGFAGVRGMTEAGGSIFYVTAEGRLHKVADDAHGIPSGADAVIGGPGVDGVNYRSNGLFITG